MLSPAGEKPEKSPDTKEDLTEDFDISEDSLDSDEDIPF